MSVRVGLGTATYPFEGPKGYFEWVELLEERGVDSVWQSDRLVSRDPFLEPMSLMATLAGATDRIKFGMNAVVASLRDPLVLAKQCATIDYLSGGRLLPVFGTGARTAPEFRRAHHEPEGRGRRVDELLEVMQRLWTEEKVSFEGECYRFEGCTISPRPVQQPLPCWIGGHSKAAIRRTARFGTGWLAGLKTPEQTRPVVEAIKAELERVGRTIAPDHYGAGFVFRFGSWDEPIAQVLAAGGRGRPADFEPSEFFAIGGAEEIIGRCRAYVDAGVSKLVLIPAARGDDEMMEQTRRLIDEVIPVVEGLTLAA